MHEEILTIDGKTYAFLYFPEDESGILWGPLSRIHGQSSSAPVAGEVSAPSAEKAKELLIQKISKVR